MKCWVKKKEKKKPRTGRKKKNHCLQKEPSFRKKKNLPIVCDDKKGQQCAGMGTQKKKASSPIRGKRFFIE